MNKTHILQEIKRTAIANGGAPLGWRRFTTETGIKEYDWLGKFWARWSDALREAGFAPNQLSVVYAKTELLEKYARLAQELGRLPTANDLRLKAKKDEAIELLSNLPLVPVEPEIAEIVRAYIQHKVMPDDPVGDALHLALASFHKCDFLLTWNCRHLANANKFSHIRRVNAMLGLYIPLLVTPLELLGGRDETEG